MSWFTSEEKGEIKRKAREALASVNATLQDAALSQRATTPMGFICKTKENARVEPRESVRSARSTEAVESPKLPATYRREQRGGPARLLPEDLDPEAID